MGKTYRQLFPLLTLLIFSQTSYAQSGLCDPNTPFFSVNLSGNPGGTWVSSPPVARQGNCCNTTAPDKCIEFSVLLDSAAVSINFAIASGAIPGGAMYYQIGCGPATPVGQPICVTGPGPHTITFCKPGNNQNTFSITSIAGPQQSQDVTTSDGCNVSMGISGLIPSTITWNSIAPGTFGQYNNYLSCSTGCDTTLVTPLPIYPPYVDYVVCGTPLPTACGATATFCDTIRAYFVPPISNTINPNPATFCANNPGITLTGNINGGAPPYVITWFNGANGTGTPVGTGLSLYTTTTGTYSMQVLDSTYPACPAKFTNITVTSTPVPVVNAGTDLLACPNAGSVPLNGSVVNATGGVWSGGGGTFSPHDSSLTASYTPTAAEIAAGSVTLTLTSTGNGPCNPVIDQVIITFSLPMSVEITPPVFCYGTVATIDATVTGGTPPYTFLWSTGATTQTLTGIPAGTYSVIVTDASDINCSVTDTLELIENPPITLVVPSNSLVSCDSTVLLTISASGGGGALNFLWNTGDTTSSITVPTGTYTITATDTFNCSASDTIVITSAMLALSAAVVEPGPVCFGDNATISALATGGFGNYTYTWSNGSTTPSINVPAGSYCVTVTDSAGCISTACGIVAEHPELTVNITGPAMVCNGSDAPLNAIASGGAPPYSYLWSTGNTTPTVTFTAGTYSVTVTDTSSAGCSATASYTLTEPAPLSVTFTTQQPSCFGGSNGSVTAIPAGGIAPYSYFWPVNGSTGSTLFGIGAGNYSVQVTDAMGCVIITSVTLTQPPQIIANVNAVTNASCFGFADGTATVGATGGTGPYSYFWTPGNSTASTATGLSAGTYTVYVTDSLGCFVSTTTSVGQPPQILVTIPVVTQNPCFGDAAGSATAFASGGTGGFSYHWLETGETTATSSGLSIGNYNVLATDNSGCSATAMVTITQPTDLVTSVASFADLTCHKSNDGSITLSATGGTIPYSYNWNPAVSTTGQATALPAGLYTMVVTDNNGCDDTLTQIISQPTALIFISAGAINATCNDSCNGQVLVIPGGGNSPYTYAWSNGATTAAVLNACAGSHYIEVTDSLGCQVDTTLVVGEPSAIIPVMAADSAHCDLNDGMASVTVSGGTPGYSYSWNSQPSQSTATANQLYPGTYSVTITDNNNCTVTDSIEVGNIPGIDSLSLTFSQPTCFGVCDGAATVQVHGGDAPFTFAWSNGGTAQTSTGICAGSTSVTVTDMFGCTATDSILVTEPTQLIGMATGTDTLCIGQSATLTASATGGMGGSYTYSWSNGMTGDTIAVSPVVTTLYTVTAADANGCNAAADTFVVFVRSEVNSLAVADTSICNGGEATLQGSASGGNGNYTYLWTPGNDTTTSIVVNPSVTTVYYLTVMDDCGSPSITDSVTVTVNPLPVVDFQVNSSQGCEPHCVFFGDLTTLTSGNVVGWLWDFGDGNSSTDQHPTHCYYNTGHYTVSLTAESDSGCLSSYAFEGFIVIHPDPVAEFTYSPRDEITTSNPMVQFHDESKDAITWLWHSSGSTDSTSTAINPFFYYPDAGNYCPTLTVTNSFGCEDTVSHCFEVLPDWTLYIPNAFSPNGDIRNEEFRAFGHNITDFEMQVYDRWGLLVYYTTNMDLGWDGTYEGSPSPMDVYVYRVNFRDIRNGTHTREGHFTLVR